MTPATIRYPSSFHSPHTSEDIEEEWSDDAGLADAPDRSRSRSEGSRSRPYQVHQRLRGHLGNHYRGSYPEDDEDYPQDSRGRRSMNSTQYAPETRRRSTFSGTAPSNFTAGGQLNHYDPYQDYSPEPRSGAPFSGNPFAPTGRPPPPPPPHQAFAHRSYSDHVPHVSHPFGSVPSAPYGFRGPEPSFQSGSTQGRERADFEDLRQQLYEDMEYKQREQDKKRREAAKRKKARRARDDRSREKDRKLDQLTAELEEVKRSQAAAAAAPPVPPPPPAPEARINAADSEYIRGVRDAMSSPRFGHPDYGSMVSSPIDYDMRANHSRYPPPHTPSWSPRHRPPPYYGDGYFDDEMHYKVDGLLHMTRGVANRLDRLQHPPEEFFEENRIDHGGHSYPPTPRIKNHESNAYQSPRRPRLRSTAEYSRKSLPTNSGPSTRESRSNLSARPPSATNSHSRHPARYTRRSSRQSQDFFEVPEESSSVRDDDAEAQERRLRRRQTPTKIRDRAHSPEPEEHYPEPRGLPAPPPIKSTKKSKSRVSAKSSKGTRARSVKSSRGKEAIKAIVPTMRDRSRAAPSIRSKSRAAPSIRNKSRVPTHRSQSRPPQAIVCESSDDDSDGSLEDDDEERFLSRSRPYAGGLDPKFSRSNLLADDAAVAAPRRRRERASVPNVPPEVPFVSQSEGESSDSLNFTSDDENLEDIVSRGRVRGRSVLGRH
ncbi:hypothetical protein F5Y16DRAFT_378236 [Xylariaceae sp. FL0255]|nr:hypothetical protein F5Y16DRAFT_378236 [Xylariaceae sp. FL0255]